MILNTSSHLTLLRELYSASGKHDQLLELLTDNKLNFKNLSSFDQWECDQWRLHALLEVKGDRGACFELASKLIQEAFENNTRWKLQDASCYDYLTRSAQGDDDKMKDIIRLLEKMIDRLPAVQRAHFRHLKEQIGEPGPNSSDTVEVCSKFPAPLTLADQNRLAKDSNKHAR